MCYVDRCGMNAALLWCGTKANKIKEHKTCVAKKKAGARGGGVDNGIPDDMVLLGLDGHRTPPDGQKDTCEHLS